MQRIGKNHSVIKLFKEALKTNKHPNWICSDDLEVLKLSLKYHLTICYLVYAYDETFQNQTKELLNALIMQSMETYEISLATFQQLQTKENHAGIFAIIELPTYQPSDLGDFILVLDQLEIPGNIGTIYRTADACGVTGILLVDSITKPHQPKLTSSARGTNLIIPTVSLSYLDAQKFLLENGYDIYLGEPELGKDYQSYSYDGKIAIVVGNERYGIHQEWYNYPHQKVFIPMIGNNHSINVSVAASILAYEAFMKRKKKNKNELPKS